MTLQKDVLAGKALPPFAALRAFEMVGRVGGIRRAAALLAIDHTVVSRHIKALEEWVGVPLFQRDGGRVRLTEVGQQYHDRVSTAMIDIASATRELMSSSQPQDLLVWCVPGFAAQWLARQLADFERTAPGFLVELRPTDNPANLAQFEADIDIRYYGDDWPPAPSGPLLRHIELARPPLLVVTSPDVAQTLSDAASPADLLEASLLHEEHHEQWRAWFASNGVVVPYGEPLPGQLMWHAHLAIAAARQGRGLALANRFLVQSDLDTGELVEVAPPGARPAIVGGYCFVSREDRWNNPAIARLRTFLRERAAG